MALAAERRAIGLKTALERDMRLVRFEEGRIEIALVEGASRNLPTELTRALTDWTGHRWIVALSTEAGQPTIDEVRRGRERDRHTDAASHPLVRKVLASFPGAQIVDVRDRNPEPEAEAPLPSPDPDGLDADPDGADTGEF